MPTVRVTGTAQMNALARDLKREGERGRGLSRRLRKNIIAASEGVKSDVAQAALAIPIRMSNPRQPSLRASIAASLRISVSPMTTKGSAVRLIADGSKMPAGMESLPGYEEGSDGYRSLRWRHPYFGNDRRWYAQDSHPYFMPTVLSHMGLLQSAVTAAVSETAAALARP
jgi:hypothetical protein